ncbi:MAG TPA: hypothetical protein EYP23_02855 [Thermoplasmata archaeon]|nr:hypothetical protein [Thermoplasmata archaeon]
MKRLLAKAFRNRFDMSREDAKALADTVKKVFNGKNEVEDTAIDKYVRALFYELQRERFVKVRREEFKEKRRLLRKYYWSLDKEAIKSEAKRKHVDDPGKIYYTLAKRVWLSHFRHNT